MCSKLNYFDLHCDTLTELYDRGETLSDTTCMVTEASISSFGKYAQVFAVFSKHELDDKACYQRFFDAVDCFEKNEGSFCKSKAELQHSIDSSLPARILSVEDLRLTSCESEKLTSLFERGVRLVTPLWSGVTCIGGSFDTDEGLTEKGKTVIEQCLDSGIICDVSHASTKSTDEILTLAEKKGGGVIASHSNSFEVYAHPRNLTDREAVRIKQLGGIVGVSIVPYHLTDGAAKCEDIIRHICHFLDIIGEDALALGCDFDGIEITPTDIRNQSEIYRLVNEMEQVGINRGLREKIFFDNAYNFFIKNMK